MHSSIFNILIYVIIPLDSCAVINEQTPTEKGTLLVLDSNGMHSSTFEYSDICYNIHLDSCAVINEQTPTEKETLLVLDSNGMHSSTFEYSDICYIIYL